LEGSEDNGGTRDEPGTLIRFPGSGWIPADGIQPLNGSARRLDSPGAQEASSDRPEPRSAFDAGDFWDSGDTQEFVGATSTADGAAPDARRRPRPHSFGERILRPRVVGGAVAAAVLAGICVEAVGLGTGGNPIRKPEAVSRHLASTGGGSSEYGSTRSSASFEARVAASLDLRHAASAVHHAAHVRIRTHRSATRARPIISPTRTVAVSYQQAPPVNNAGTTSGEPASSYQSPSSASSSLPPTTATSASASGVSGSGSGSGPARPSPTGVLTCISNCG
jgi:hypothetical protein